MKEKRVEEIMIPLDQYPHIPYWFTLREAIAEMEKAQFEINGRVSRTRFILVFDEDYSLMGTVRRRDIMRGLEPEFLHDHPLPDRKKLFDVKHDDTLFSVYSYDKLVNGLRDQAETQVKDVMIPVAVTIDHDDHIIKAMYEMVENNVTLLPVIKDDTVAGVVRSNDLFHEIARILL